MVLTFQCFPGAWLVQPPTRKGFPRIFTTLGAPATWFWEVFSPLFLLGGKIRPPKKAAALRLHLSESSLLQRCWVLAACRGVRSPKVAPQKWEDCWLLERIFSGGFFSCCVTMMSCDGWVFWNPSNPRCLKFLRLEMVVTVGGAASLVMTLNHV